MTADDLDAVVALEASLQDFPWSPGNFADSLAAGHEMQVLRLGGDVVGFSVVVSIVDEAINNQNWFEKRKLKVFNCISEKLFPEYWNLNIQNLEHKKLKFSQYKKMYEGRGDTVKAIEYQGKELDVDRTILWENGGQYLERLQLSLNKYSQSFGQSWHWAVCWIIGLGIFIYIFYCRSLGFTVGSGSPNDIETFNKLFSYFVEFINPIRKGEFIQIPMFIDGKIKSEYVTITGCARVIDFFWRIVITYLGYKLIQAFRKYSKKTS